MRTFIDAGDEGRILGDVATITTVGCVVGAIESLQGFRDKTIQQPFRTAMYVFNSPAGELFLFFSESNWMEFERKRYVD